VSDELTISGGGSVAVATDTLIDHAQSLEAVRDEAAGSARQLAGIDRLVVATVDLPASAAEAEREMDAARALLAELERGAGLLATALRLGADAYGAAERYAERAMQHLAARLGYAAGFFLPLLGVLLVPSAGFVIGGLVVAAVLFPDQRRDLVGQLRRWLGANTSTLSDPFTVGLVRMTVMSIDDVAAGALRIPPGTTEALSALGVVTTGSTAAVIATVGNQFGVFAETPVSVRPTASSTGAAPPVGLAGRVDRLPSPETGPLGEQIIIDRISTPGEPDRFEVYIGGTSDWSVIPGSEPLDMTSNVQGIAELPAGSYRAVEQAMADAGVTAASDVVVTGHSQGGLIATALAASGDYSVRGIVTIGAPAGHIIVPADIPVVAIEHTDDLVPALAGVRANHDAILVERRAFEPGADLGDSPLPAHERAPYRETAALADQSADAKLRAAIRSMSYRENGGATVTTTTYLAERGERG